MSRGHRADGGSFVRMLVVNITWVINLSSTVLILPSFSFVHLYYFLIIFFSLSSSYIRLSCIFPVSSSCFSALFFTESYLMIKHFASTSHIFHGCYFILTWSPNFIVLYYSLFSLLLCSLCPLSDIGWSGAEGEGSWNRDKRETEFPHWSRRGCQELEGTLMKNLAAFTSSWCAVQLTSLKMMEHMKTLCEINQHFQNLRSLRSSDSSHVVSVVWV